jgi:hypothetical protein
MSRVVEDVFVTEGVPHETFVEPPNFGQILVDIRRPGKPVIVEGASGTGKTSTVKKVLERLGRANVWTYWTARKAGDAIAAADLANTPRPGIFIIDDFHKLPAKVQEQLADIAKISAEEADTGTHPKLVLIGINQVGAALVQFAPDIAKRCAIHQIHPASKAVTLDLIARGCAALNISFDHPNLIYAESQGDYWLTQALCSEACTTAKIYESQPDPKNVGIDISFIRRQMVDRLQHAYYESVKDFCRGRRFRPSNDPYYRILRFISTKGGNQSSVDLVELANANPEIAGSINNVKDHRLAGLLKDKPKAGLYFYYNPSTARFAIEDPAVFYFLRNLDWERLRSDCGFRDTAEHQKPFDVAISFAGENRELAREIASRLSELDVAVFFDENFEVAYLGRRLGDEFERVFSTGSRFVLCLLDKFHREKIWPTFERDTFLRRIAAQEVIPIYLDKTNFPGVPSDVFGINFIYDPLNDDWRAKVDDEIVLPMIDRIG